MALFFCRRSVREPLKTRTPRFTVEEIEPFVALEYRDGAPNGGVAVAVLGVAIQRADGAWGLHRLSDEAKACRGRQGSTSSETVERLKNRAVLEVKKRLVLALNRLRKHHAGVYVYSTAPKG